MLWDGFSLSEYLFGFFTYDCIRGSFSDVFPPHDFEKIRIFHISMKRIFLDLEMEVHVFVVFLWHAARSDISEVRSFLDPGTDRDIRRYL